MCTLGVNIDHVATLRQARGGREPDPATAAAIAEIAGASGITAHLREDRRHMQDRDLYLLKQTVTTHLNLEMAATQEMIAIAVDLQPWMCTLVPESREERTTEGGLAVREKEKDLAPKIAKLRDNNILVSLFINPDMQEIKAARRLGATHIELHTGYYANATNQKLSEELARLRDAAIAAGKLELHVNAGHGLDYRNVSAVAQIENMEELNIGHSIVSRSIFVGMETAVRDMAKLLNEATALSLLKRNI